MSQSSLTESVLDSILDLEGRVYTNRPNDLGGPTKFGITLKTLSDWRNKACLPEDVESMQEVEARAIYNARYINPFSVWAGHEVFFRLLVDSAVQHGVERVQGWMASIVTTTTDPEVMRRKLFQRRMIFYGTIITSNHSQAENAHGWMVRLSGFVR